MLPLLQSLPLIVTCALVALTAGGAIYYLAALWGARAYVRRKVASRRAAANLPPFAPAVSILKPLRGVDDGMYEALAGHCRQNYPGPFEILFGVSRHDDPAVPVIERLRQEFPALPIRLIICEQSLGANGKVSTLIQIAVHAQHDFLLVDDADIRVPPDYLTRVMNGFRDEKTGMVTALYHGHCGPNPTLWSRVEALGISTDFIPGVLTARMMERGMRFGLGATLAVRRSALDSIGGFTALKDLLADDYELGARIARNNWRVELAPLVVETGVPAYHWRAFANHQLRWLRSTRDSRPGGYIGMVFTFGIIWAALTVIVSAGALWAFTLLSLCALGRLAVALSIGAGLLNDRRSLGDLWLIPLRDAVALALWVWSFSSDIVEWRGLRFRLRSGRLEPI